MNKTLRNLALVALAVAPFSAFAEIIGSGTAEDPYQIATAEDLGAAYLKVNENPTGITYFVQTADIDMAGVTDYHAINGGGGVYTAAINYDGKNHVIKNFAPTLTAADAGKHNYYMTSVFGVLTGTVRNLGIVDAKIVNKDGQGTGFLGAYAGHSSAASIAPKTVIENVYATGTIDAVGNANYIGGFVGTTGSEVEINNCFVIADVKGSDKVGGLIGRQRTNVTLNNVYVAGTVEAKGQYVALVVASDKTTYELNANNVIAFNSGLDNAVVGSVLKGDVKVATAANQAELIDAVKAWPAFSATEEISGYPALNYALSGKGTQDDPYIISSAEDLANAYRGVDCTASQCYYFVQTADIDMLDVQDYHAINGYNGQYKATINYDGRNHIISNFAPNMESDPNQVDGTDYYYCTSIFGVFSGEIKNLGVVDAYCASTQGFGILAAYGGYGTTELSKVENVFVTGEVSGETASGKTSNYTGGLFGTTSTGLVILNSFANVSVNAPKFGGAIIGRSRNYVEMENVYAAGTVAGDGDIALIASTDKSDGSAEISAVNVIAFNSGSENAVSAKIALDGTIDVATDANMNDLIADVKSWEAFSADKVVNGYPALAAFDYGESSGISDIVVDEVEANGPAVYYNLQGVEVANPENGIYIVRRGNKVTKELIRK